MLLSWTGKRAAAATAAAAAVSTANASRAIPLVAAVAPKMPRAASCDQHEQRRTMATFVKGNGKFELEADRHLALNQRQLLEALLSHKRLATLEDKHLFPTFARLLSTALHARMLGVWNELKSLYNPVDPDKDLRSPVSMQGKEKHQNGKAYKNFVRAFSDIVDKAHFTPLNPSTPSVANDQAAQKEAVRGWMEKGRSKAGRQDQRDGKDQRGRALKGSMLCIC